MNDAAPLTGEAVLGLLVAVECMQEVLISSRLTDPEHLARQYGREVRQYAKAGRDELARTPQTLVDRLLDPDRLRHRALIRSTPAGHA